MELESQITGPRNQFLVSYYFISNHPKTQWLKATNIYYFSWIYGSSEQSLWSQLGSFEHMWSFVLWVSGSVDLGWVLSLLEAWLTEGWSLTSLAWSPGFPSSWSVHLQRLTWACSQMFWGSWSKWDLLELRMSTLSLLPTSFISQSQPTFVGERE